MINGCSPIPLSRCRSLAIHTLAKAIVVALFLLPQGVGAQSLAAGSGTSPDADEATASAAVVEQIRRLADESRRGAPQFSMTGVVSRDGDVWEVNGEPFRVTGETILSGDLAPGATAEVRGLLQATRPLIAREVRVHPTSPASADTPSHSRMTPADARMLR